MGKKRKHLHAENDQGSARSRYLARKDRSCCTIETNTDPGRALSSLEGCGVTRSSEHVTCLHKCTSGDAFVLPTELPFADQYILLQHVQEILEEMCIRVGLATCPKVMEEYRWTQPRSLELNKWIHYLWDVKAQPSDFPIRVNRDDHEKLLKEVANIRHSAVHRDSQNTSTLRSLLQAALAFADLHQDGVAKDGILCLLNLVEEISNEISSQQELLQKHLREQVDTILAQQGTLLRQVQESAGQQNQRMLTLVGRKMVNLLPASAELSAVSGWHSAALAHSEESWDPWDIEEIEDALLEAEQVAGETETIRSVVEDTKTSPGLG